MSAFRAVANTLLASVGGCLAGGAAAGAVLMLVSGFPDFSGAASVGGAVLGFGFYLLSVIAMAFLGAVWGGPIFGFIPTLLLGMVLTLMRNVPPFQRGLAWALAGAAAGIAIHLWVLPDPSLGGRSPLGKTAWGIAWAIGGAASMSVYWLAFGGRSARTKIAR